MNKNKSKIKKTRPNNEETLSVYEFLKLFGEENMSSERERIKKYLKGIAAVDQD